MSVSLREGQTTFTRDRMDALAQKHPFKLSDLGGGIKGAPFEFRVRHPGKINNTSPGTNSRSSAGLSKPVFFPSRTEKSELFASLVKKYVGLAVSLQRLDESVFCDLIEFSFREKKPRNTIYDETCNLLERLPAVPIELHNPQTDASYDEIPEYYFVDDSKRSWYTLLVNQHVSLVVLGVALTYSTGTDNPHGFDSIFGGLCDTIADLLEETINLSEGTTRFSLR